MADHSSAQIRPPKNWQDFERDSKILFECILNDRGVQKNGRAGQSQHGVDIFGRQDGTGDKWIGVQCKGKDANFGNKVTDKELRDEVTKSRKFEPKIREFYLITTAADDAEIQKVARQITNEFTNQGDPLSVNVWGWGQLEEKIAEHPDALRAFCPDSTPFTDELLAGQEAIASNTAELKNSINQLLELQKSGNAPTPSNDTISAENEILDKVLHQQIDQYRDLLNEGKAKTALMLLEKFKKSNWESAPDRIKFRLITNIAAAKYDISTDNAQECSDLFIEAFDYQPDDPKAKANANLALAHLILGHDDKAIEAAKDAIKKDDTNAEAVSYLIQAQVESDETIDIFEIIPKAVEGSHIVDFAIIKHLRAKNDDRWVKFAREAHIRHPENDQIIRYSAEAELEAILSRGNIFNGESAATKSDFEQLRKTSLTLQNEWDKQVASESQIPDSALPYNLALTYKIIDDSEKEKSVLAMATEHFPDNSDLARMFANYQLEHGNETHVIELLKKANNNPVNLLLLAEVQISINIQDALKTLDQLEEFSSLSDLLHVSFYIWTPGMICNPQEDLARPQFAC